MVSLNPGLISSFSSRNSLIDFDTLLSLSCFCTFHPQFSAKTAVKFASLSLLVSRQGCGPVLGFLEAKPRKKGCCSPCSGFLRRCNKSNLGWDSEEAENLETEILEFMKNSQKPEMFPSKRDLTLSGRFDLVEKILKQGGWLALGWDSEEHVEEEGKIEVQAIENVTPRNLHMEKQLHSFYSQENDGTWSDGASKLSSDPLSSKLTSSSFTSLEVDAGNESGIEGILTRLEKERNLSLGISLREKGEINSDISRISLNGSVSRSSKYMTASEFQEAGEIELHGSCSSGEYAETRYQETKPLSVKGSLSNSPTPETWRTWSMRRAGFSDEDFEAAEICSSGLDSVKKDDTNMVSSSDTMNKNDRTANSSEDISKIHIKSRLQHLQAELSSVLHSLKGHPDKAVMRKDSEIHSGNLENLYDDWEFRENEIMHAQDNLRSMRAKLAVLEGKMSMAIIDAQRIVREKQRRIDHASRALRLLRTVNIVWRNFASEVLLSGSFDGWSTQRKMKKAQNGVFSLSLRLYPGKYEIKFIVDGEWRVDPLRPIVTYDGYENNLLIID